MARRLFYDGAMDDSDDDVKSGSAASMKAAECESGLRYQESSRLLVGGHCKLQPFGSPRSPRLRFVVTPF